MESIPDSGKKWNHTALKGDTDPDRFPQSARPTLWTEGPTGRPATYAAGRHTAKSRRHASGPFQSDNETGEIREGTLPMALVV